MIQGSKESSLLYIIIMENSPERLRSIIPHVGIYV